ncbi:MAG TPA: hypothetical protein P5205_16570 [Candidatus Paceibacterota bacterium]|nr:hypothetical protein [Verrucomicrobiota bacterium]HSA11977.1 hypothetical protein [Candidatus Paceibacterota bacterium]
MTIRWRLFNLYLLVTVAVTMVCGCQTSSSGTKPKKLLSTLRLHLEASRSATEATEVVPIYRVEPIMVRVEKVPFLTEGDVAEAKVVDVGDDFALCIRFGGLGAALFEQQTAANRGRRIAIFSQFGEHIENARWLGAPVIASRSSDSVLTFTPDATRAEAEEIATGLNNVTEKVKTWVDR